METLEQVQADRDLWRERANDWRELADDLAELVARTQRGQDIEADILTLDIDERLEALRAEVPSQQSRLLELGEDIRDAGRAVAAALEGRRGAGLDGETVDAVLVPWMRANWRWRQEVRGGKADDVTVSAARRLSGGGGAQAYASGRVMRGRSYDETCDYGMVDPDTYVYPDLEPGDDDECEECFPSDDDSDEDDSDDGAEPSGDRSVHQVVELDPTRGERGVTLLEETRRDS